MTLLFDLLVIAFLLSVAYICIDWGIASWRLCNNDWYLPGWNTWVVRALAIWAILIGLYNLVFGLMKIWFTIEGYII